MRVIISEMENPFSSLARDVNSPNPLLTREGFKLGSRSGRSPKERVKNLPSEPSLDKGGQGEFTLNDLPLNKGGNEGDILETRRADLRPEVRAYADRLHARILEIYSKHGVDSAAELFEKSKLLKSGAVAKSLLADAKELVKLQDGLAYLLDNEEFGPGMEWEAEKENVRELERERLLEFFGREFDVPPIPKGITKEIFDFWKENMFELRYWPRVRMTEDADFPGWKHKPGMRNNPKREGIEFYDEFEEIENHPENLANPNLAGLKPDELPGRWMLTDSRPKPNFASGGQTYENDGFVRDVLKSLLPETLNPEASACLRNRIRPHIFTKPRFWDAFKTALRLEGVPGVVVRLPREIEANAMGQGPGWHGTDMSEWCEEAYNPSVDARLISGDSGDGGASFLSWCCLPLDNVGFRPLVVFP